MTPDEIATLMNDTAGQRWGDEAHFQRFAAAFQKRISAASMPAIKLAMEAERENGARAEREACAQIAETTVCDTHLPTGVQIYGSKAAAAIRARSNA
jgi:uncharacterized membrane protein